MIARRLAVGLLALVVGAGEAAAQVDTGIADFSRLVVVGDSLLAGFADGGLVEGRQLDSVGALIHRQAVGDGDFEQPLVGEPGIPPLLELVSLQPLLIDLRPGLGEPLNADLPRPYDNLAVPGARVRDTIERETDIEEEDDPPGMHDLVLRGMGTVLEQAVSLEPTFAVVWIGLYDTLGAVLAGTVDEETLTPIDEFLNDLRTVVTVLRGATGQTHVAVATNPDPTRMPFVTAVPPWVVDLDSGEPVLAGGRRVFLLGPDGPLRESDRVLLTATPLLEEGIGLPLEVGGTGEPLPPEVVLTAEEVFLVRTRNSELNQIIVDTAILHGAALVDIGPVLNAITDEGVSVGGIRLTREYVLGGIYSLDGIHPTRLATAFTANLFVQAINQAFGASIPLVNLQPFLFGDLAESAGVPPEAVPSARLSRAAVEGLLAALRVPSAGAGARPEPPAGEPPPLPLEPSPYDDRGLVRPTLDPW